MRIHLLGTAAGGGVPQWNCNCIVCREARTRNGRVQPRTQSSVAVSADGRHWFLLNASPDIRAQIESFAPLFPDHNKTRNSPIEGVLLTNADLDHSLGLLLLREGEKLRVHATAAARHALTEGISIAQTLNFFSGVEWIEPPTKREPLLLRNGTPSGLEYEAIPLSGKPPRFMSGKTAPSARNVIGYRIHDAKTDGTLLFLPDVAEVSKSLLPPLIGPQLLLFDGTFWSENEMRERGTGILSASDMGHWPISGEGGSLEWLANFRIPHKIYTHINNTNPILIEDSPERTAVKAAGCIVGEDGMEFEI
ncbi:MAG TPA: pyrroloquinoline quinone biosynthesis protein PqqB [Verrucomicrobiae bacterium]|nr:pyrroloquinoline quinone biosynthesis protein PqqB [Verrucomicrobiae bacterium]